jgi:hypothetical protein
MRKYFNELCWWSSSLGELALGPELDIVTLAYPGSLKLSVESQVDFRNVVTFRQ